jgi:hypothetical protein
MSVPTASATSKAYRTQTGIAIPAFVILEMSMYHESIGTNAANDGIIISGEVSSTRAFAYKFCSDGLFHFYPTGYAELGTDLVDQDVWTTWKIVNDVTNRKIWIWKNGALVVSNASGVFANTGMTAGRVQLEQRGYTLSGVLTYIDYVKVHTENGQLIQTIIGD